MRTKSLVFATFIAFFIILILGVAGYFIYKNFGGKIVEKIEKEDSNQKNTEKAVGDLMQFKIFVNNGRYFSDEKKGNCQWAGSLPLVRYMPKSDSIGKKALFSIKELLRGVTSDEKANGYRLFSGFPEETGITEHKKNMEDHGLDVSSFGEGYGGYTVKSVNIKDGVAYVDFNIAINVGSGVTFGCAMESFKNSIHNTLTQFSEIDDVVITAEGLEFPCANQPECVKEQEYNIGKTDIFIEVAQPGEGVTHLARRVLNKYLKQYSYFRNLNLTTEQQIYVEDCVQKRTESNNLKIGDSVNFPASLIKEAIDNSLDIAPDGIAKYILPTSIEADVVVDRDKSGAVIWIKYLDGNNTSVSNAKVTLEAESKLLNSGILPANPYTWTYGVKYSKEKNCYEYHYLTQQGSIKERVCFKIIAEAEAYAPQFKNLKCVDLTEETQSPADETADLSAEDLLRPSEAFGEGGAEEGWQTYRNEEYGFDVKYPTDWQIEEWGQGIIFITPAVLDCRAQGGYECSLGNPTVEVYASVLELYGNEQGLTFEEWFEDRKKYALFGDRRSIKVSDYEGFDVSESGMIGYRTIFLFHNSKIARLSIGDSPGFMDDFNQMLSTFRFLEKKESQTPDNEACQYQKGEYEMRIYDSLGRMTGIIDGQIKEEIPNSIFDEETNQAVVFTSEEYTYEIFCLGRGNYQFSRTMVKEGEPVTFEAVNIPIYPDQTHRYQLNWEVLKRNEAGATLLVDANKDGVFEKTIKSDQELTCEEFFAQMRSY